MKGSLVVVAFFCAGCMIGAVNNFQYDMHSVSMYVLYALMLQVGISIGSNKKLKELIKSLRLKMLLVPMATIAGTSFYTVVCGWIIYYFVNFLIGNNADLGFNSMISQPSVNVIFLLVTVVIAFVILSFNIQNGLEKVTVKT